MKYKVGFRTEKGKPNYIYVEADTRSAAIEKAKDEIKWLGVRGEYRRCIEIPDDSTLPNLQPQAD